MLRPRTRGESTEALRAENGRLWAVIEDLRKSNSELRAAKAESEDAKPQLELCNAQLLAENEHLKESHHKLQKKVTEMERKLQDEGLDEDQNVPTVEAVVKPWPKLTSSFLGWMLWEAAKNGDTLLVERLIDFDADLSHKSGEYNSTPLHEAALQGHVDALKILLKAGAPIHATNRLGTSPLHYSLYPQPNDCTIALLEAGADVNIRGCIGRTPLHDTVVYGQLEKIPILLKAGADNSLQDANGKTAYDLAKTSSARRLLSQQ